jgi:glutaconyl-CoA decarboxylase
MKKYVITVNGQSYEVEVEEVGGAKPAAATQITPRPTPAPTPKPTPTPTSAPKQEQKPAASKPSGAAAASAVKAPMPGTILDVKVQQGARVKPGDILLILEAMKMENEILAAKEGTVTNIYVSKGQSVNAGDPMVVVE